MTNEASISLNTIAIRKLIVVALLFMGIGTGLELYLLDHYEDTLQLLPIICILTSILLFAALLFKNSNGLQLAFKLVLVATALSGLVGTFLHLKANYEFESEMKPTADTWSVLVESLSGALPALAPGSMILFSLIGYIYLLLINQKK